MLEILRKLALMGLGVISLSEEKLKSLIKEMEEKGEVSMEEGEDLLKKLLGRAEEEKKAIEERIRKRLREGLEKIDIVTKDDLTKLEKKVNTLEKKVNKLFKEVEKEG